MAFKGVTFAGQNVTPKDDGALYMAHYGDGILDGCAMTLSGDDLVVASGHFIAGGRVCHVDGATNVDLSGRVNLTGYIQVIMNYDLSQGEGSQWYTSFVESATTTFPALTQDDINGTDTLYQVQLAVVQVSGGNLTSIYSAMTYSYLYAVSDTSIASLYGTTNGAIFRCANGGGSYYENSGPSVVFSDGANVMLRPNGQFSTSGQMFIDTSGQQHGGHYQRFEYGTKAVSVNTDATIMSFTIANAGVYMLTCFMDSNTSNSGIYNNQLIISSASLNKTIRSTMYNGGGSCYCGIYNVGANSTVEVHGFSPAACTLRATFTATQLA